MSTQRNHQISTPNSTSVNRSLHSRQENSPETSRYNLRKLEINPNHSGSEDADSIKSENSHEELSARNDFSYYFHGFSPKKINKKDILLGQQHIDILGRKSYITGSDRKLKHVPESLTEMPSQDYHKFLSSAQTAESPSKRPLERLFRRKSCACSCCGGCSALEKKIQDLPHIPTARELKNKADRAARFQRKKTIVLNNIKNKHEIGLKSRDYKYHGKGGTNLRSLVAQAQARNSLTDGLSPKSTPTNEQKFRYSTNNIKGDMTPRTIVLESKQNTEEAKGEIEKSPPQRKTINRQETDLLAHIEEDSSRNDKTEMLEDNKKQIAKLLKKKAVKIKKGIDCSSLKNVYYSVLKMDSSSRDFQQILPRLKIDTMLQRLQKGQPLEKTEEVAQELEEDKNMKSIKAKLNKITGKDKEQTKTSGKKEKGILTSRLIDQSKFQNNSNSYGSLTERSRSLPINKFPDSFKVARMPIEKNNISQQVRFSTQTDEKEKSPRAKRPRLKLKKLDMLGISVLHNEIGSVRTTSTTPKLVTLKQTGSARLKTEARNDWLIKNYNIKPGAKKECLA